MNMCFVIWVHDHAFLYVCQGLWEPGISSIVGFCKRHIMPFLVSKVSILPFPMMNSIANPMHFKQHWMGTESDGTVTKSEKAIESDKLIYWCFIVHSVIGRLNIGVSWVSLPLALVQIVVGIRVALSVLSVQNFLSISSTSIRMGNSTVVGIMPKCWSLAAPPVMR